MWRRKLLTSALVLAVPVASAACGTRRDAPDTTSATHVYRCDDGLRLIAQFEPQRVWLFLPERTISLPQVPSGSGMQYTDGTVSFRGLRNDASLETGDRGPLRCVDVPEEAEWEDARLRAVHVRATGQDRSWTVEITERQQIVFVGDGGRTRHVFSNPAVSPAEPEGAIAIYEAADQSDRISVSLERRGCRLPGTDRGFDAAVTVTFRGRTFDGCGAILR